LGLKGELELIKLLKKFGLNYKHRLKQKKITDFLADSDQKTREECIELFRKNRMLPRKRLTYEIDLFAWKENHWAALAIEEKNQSGVRKILDINDEEIVLTANEKKYKEYGKSLWLQCKGESLLGKAFCLAKGIKAEILPVGVVDYDIRVNSEYADWAYYEGVFFLQNNFFPSFLEDYIENKKWIQEIVRTKKAWEEQENLIS